MDLSDAERQVRWRGPRVSADLSAASGAKDQQIARLSTALAANDKEIAELRARVAELEQWLACRRRQEITLGLRDPSLA